MKLGYSELGHFSTQINPVITNPGYNEKMIGPKLYVITEFDCILFYNLNSLFYLSLKNVKLNIPIES
jgi:hypothetical protein